jgi:hypothetical protein
VLGHLADDVAYGTGVWAGALRARSTAPVRPVIAWHPFRAGPAGRSARRVLADRDAVGANEV